MDYFFCIMIHNLNSSLCKSSGHARHSLFSEDTITKWKSHWAAKISLHKDSKWTSVSVISESCPTLMSCAVFSNLYFLFFNYPSFLLRFLEISRTNLAILISKCQRNSSCFCNTFHMGDSQSYLAAASITQSSCHHSNAGTEGSLNLYHLQQCFPISESDNA